MKADNWTQLVRDPRPGDHLVQVYQDEAFLRQTVTAYIDEGLSRGESAVIIATPEHRKLFGYVAHERLRILDAHETLAAFMVDGYPDWKRFHQIIGGLIAELRLSSPTVCAYGEMVDVLWQRGEKDAATRLEGYWNELGRLQTFSLLCAYRIDPLDPASYSGPLQCVCSSHTHLIPAQDYSAFNEAVLDTTREVFEAPLSKILLSLALSHRDATSMPAGQSTLMWLKKNMPRSSDKVLAELRKRRAAATALS